MASVVTLSGCDVSTAPQAATRQDSVVLRWDEAALEAVRHGHLGPPVVARALAIVHTSMYDAWAAYDKAAIGTRLGGALRRPAGERTLANKERAVSVAAYRALVDLFPSEKPSFDQLMQQLGHDPEDRSTDTTATGIGNQAAEAVLSLRHHDGSNQLGNLSPGAYSDYTGYQPVNTPSSVTDPNRWQPLLVQDSNGSAVPQKFVAPQWGLVIPFALTSGAQFRPAAVPNLYPDSGYVRQAQEIMEYSANMTDEQKAIIEYWADGPGTEQPPGHWARFAQWVAVRDGLGIDENVKLFFVLTNALLDVGIAVWDCKRAFDYVRPVTAIRFLMAGQEIRAWGGPFQGTQTIPGEQWQAYQTSAVPTPAFPEFTSGHSGFSAAAAEVLRSYTGSDAFGYSVTVTAGSSRVEPGAVPGSDVALTFSTFSEAADQAGMSRRYGGIHFREGDLQSRALGRTVGAQAWSKAQTYFAGSAVE